MRTVLRNHVNVILTLLTALMLVAQVDVASADHSSNLADELAMAGNDAIVFKHFDGQEIRLMNQHSGKFLVSARWGSDDSERNVQVAADANHQTVGRNKGMDWVLRPAGGGYWFIVNLTSGLYLSWDRNDSNVSTWGNCPKCGNDNLQWRFVEVRGKNDTFMIYNKASGEALDQAYHGREHNRENVRLTPGEDPNNGGWNWVFFTSYPHLSRLRVLDIESVKAIKTSEGTDAATSILFSGIDLAVQLGAAAASGGTSAAMSAARAGTVVTRTALKEAAEQAIKKKLRSEFRDIAGISNGDLAAAGLNVAGVGSGGAGAAPQNGLSQVASTVLNAMSSEYLFNRLYGKSPDDLDIQVNGVSIFPNGGRDNGRKIESQQTLPVDKQVIFYHDAGFSLNLIEYDSASADDNLGGITWRDSAQNIATTDGNGDDWWQGDHYKTQRYEDVVFSNESEGSLYLVTFSVSALRPVGGALLQKHLERDPLAWGGGYNKAKLQAQEQDDLAEAVEIRFGKYCDERGGIPLSWPQADWPKSRVVIKNDSGRRLHVSRVEESGAEKPIRTMEPGAVFAQDTVSGHRYVLLDSDGNCAAKLDSFEGRNTWSIGAPESGSAAAGAGSAGSNASGTPTATPLAAGSSCELRGNFASPQGGAVQAVDVWLSNTGQSDLLLYWMNYQGAETDYGSQPRPIDTITPGARKNYPMAAGAGYLATDAMGICNAVIIVQPAGNEYLLAADPSAVAPATNAAANQNYPAFSTAMNTVSDYVQAGGNSCDMRNAIASDPNAPQVDKQISLNNTGSTPLLVYWLNYEGAEANYQNEPRELMYIAPGQSAALVTYAGFAFVAVDTNGNCHNVFQADQNTDGVFLGDGSFASAGTNAPVNNQGSGQMNGNSASAQHSVSDCALRGQMVSTADAAMGLANVNISNTGPGTIQVWWVNEAGAEGDYNNNPQPVAWIDSGQTQSLQAYVGYKFVILEDTAACLGVADITQMSNDFAFAASNAQSAGAADQGVVQTADPNSGPDAATCAIRGQTASEPWGQTDVPVTMTNTGSGQLYVFWIDGNGMETDYSGGQQPLVSVAAGQSQSFQAYPGYRFLVQDQEWNCLGIAEVSESYNDFSFGTAAAGPSLSDYSDLDANDLQICSGYPQGTRDHFACLDSVRLTKSAQQGAAQPVSDNAPANDNQQANGQEPGWDRADVFYQPAFDYCAGQLGLAQESAEYGECYYAYPNY